MTANADHRNGAVRNVQICAVLRHWGEFIKVNNISTRPVYGNTKKNVIADPLSRGPKYFKDFRDAATGYGRDPMCTASDPSRDPWPYG